MDKTTKIMIWVTAMVIILVGGGVTAVVLNNRFHTERDNSLTKQEAQQKAKDAEQKSQTQFSNSLGLITCKSAADTAYWDYIKLNASSSRTDSSGQVVYTANQTYWDYGDKQKQQAYSDCYKQYPTN